MAWNTGCDSQVQQQNLVLRNRSFVLGAVCNDAAMVTSLITQKLWVLIIKGGYIYISSFTSPRGYMLWHLLLHPFLMSGKPLWIVLATKFYDQECECIDGGMKYSGMCLRCLVSPLPATGTLEKHSWPESLQEKAIWLSELLSGEQLNRWLPGISVGFT